MTLKFKMENKTTSGGSASSSSSSGGSSGSGGSGVFLGNHGKWNDENRDFQRRREALREYGCRMGPEDGFFTSEGRDVCRGMGLYP